eukprot:3566473-Prymnesium_polylepis.1
MTWAPRRLVSNIIPQRGSMCAPSEGVRTYQNTTEVKKDTRARGSDTTFSPSVLKLLRNAGRNRSEEASGKEL